MHQSCLFRLAFAFLYLLRGICYPGRCSLFGLEALLQVNRQSSTKSLPIGLRRLRRARRTWYRGTKKDNELENRGFEITASIPVIDFWLYSSILILTKTALLNSTSVNEKTKNKRRRRRRRFRALLHLVDFIADNWTW